MSDRCVIVVRRGATLAGDWHRHYIGRPSPLGNPWSHKREAHAELVGSRADAIRLYTGWLDALPVDSLQQVSIREMADRVRAGERIALECWCAPHPCHGHVIADRILNLVNQTGT